MPYKELFPPYGLTFWLNVRGLLCSFSFNRSCSLSSRSRWACSAALRASNAASSTASVAACRVCSRSCRPHADSRRQEWRAPWGHDTAPPSPSPAPAPTPAQTPKTSQGAREGAVAKTSSAGLRAPGSCLAPAPPAWPPGRPPCTHPAPRRRQQHVSWQLVNMGSAATAGPALQWRSSGATPGAPLHAPLPAAGRLLWSLGQQHAGPAAVACPLQVLHRDSSSGALCRPSLLLCSRLAALRTAAAAVVVRLAPAQQRVQHVRPARQKRGCKPQSRERHASRQHEGR